MPVDCTYSITEENGRVQIDQASVIEELTTKIVRLEQANKEVQDPGMSKTTIENLENENLRLEEANTRLRGKIDRLGGRPSSKYTPSSPPSLGSGLSVHRGEEHPTDGTRPTDGWRNGTGEGPDEVSVGTPALPDVVSTVREHKTSQHDRESRLTGFAAHRIPAVHALPQA